MYGSSNRAELIQVHQRFAQLRPRFDAALPEDLALLRERLAETHLGRRAERAVDPELLFRIGAILGHRSGLVRKGELSRALDVPLSTATRMVGWLVLSEYAERQPDPEDRRIVRVTLTEAGLGMYRALNAFIAERIARWVRRFTPEECEYLLHLMRKFVAILEEEL